MKKVLVVLLNCDSIFFVMNNSSDSSKKLNVGDILDSHWGYEQTNVDYYEVVGLTPKGVKIRQIESQRNYTGSMCGECVLDISAGICPITLCPKGLLNGPCGGMDKGKCEVDKDRDCAWVLIYNELEKKNKLDTLKKVQQPKDFKKAQKPRKLIMTKLL